MTGPFEPFEGRRGLWEQAADGAVNIPDFPLGSGRGADDPFRITRTIFKGYPSQIHTQAPIGLALQLREAAPVSEIRSIHIDTYQVAASTASSEPEKWDPKTRETADHSIPFLVAAALQDGAVNAATFTDGGIADPGLRAIMARMTLAEDPEFTARYPAEYNCRITIETGGETGGGQRHTAHTAWPKGHRHNAIDRCGGGGQIPQSGLRHFVAGAVRRGAGGGMGAAPTIRSGRAVRYAGGVAPAGGRLGVSISNALSPVQGVNGAQRGVNGIRYGKGGNDAR